MPTAHPDTLWQRAEAKWADIQANSPDLGPAVTLQRRILRLVLDTSRHVSVPKRLDPAATLDRWRRGLPALRNEPIPIPDESKAVLPPLCTAIAEGGAGDSVLHIRDALASGRIDAGSLVSVSLMRNHKAIRTSALHMGFSPDLLWLVGELASSPLAYLLQQDLTAALASFDEWDRGYCPVCGSWPVLIERLTNPSAPERPVLSLRCSFCALAWRLTSHRCVYCGNAEETFVAAAPDLNRKDRRLDLCSRCGCYTKTIAVGEPTPFPLLAIEDLATMDLDQAAMTRDYRRPEIYDLDSIEPSRTNC